MEKIEVKHLEQYISLQQKLLKKFFDTYPHINDFQFLLDFPKIGEITVDNHKWEFKKHGVGYTFTRLDTPPFYILNIHNHVDNPNWIDVWRFLNFLESLGIIVEIEVVNGFLEELREKGLLIPKENNSYEAKI